VKKPLSFKRLLVLCIFWLICFNKFGKKAHTKNGAKLLFFFVNPKSYCFAKVAPLLARMGVFEKDTKGSE